MPLNRLLLGAFNFNKQKPTGAPHGGWWRPARLVTIALANKLARICWALMRTGELYRIGIMPLQEA